MVWISHPEGRKKKEKKIRGGRDWRERSDSLNTGFRAQVDSETCLKAMKVTVTHQCLSLAGTSPG